MKYIKITDNFKGRIVYQGYEINAAEKAVKEYLNESFGRFTHIEYSVVDTYKNFREMANKWMKDVNFINV